MFWNSGQKLIIGKILGGGAQIYSSYKMPDIDPTVASNIARLNLFLCFCSFRPDRKNMDKMLLLHKRR